MSISCSCGCQVEDPRDAIIVYGESEEGYVLVCKSCVSALGTCGACEKVRECLFETSPVQLPKVVVKTIQNGNVQMQIQIKNPERIAQTCVNCLCWNKEEKYCIKQNIGFCARYAPVLQKAGYPESKDGEAQ